MKTIFITLAAALTLTSGCKKDATGPMPEPATQVNELQGTAIQVQENKIQGKWKLVRMTGGLAGMDMNAADEGIDQHYDFKNNGSCDMTSNDNVTSTTYRLFKAESYTNGGDGDFVGITKGDTYEYYFVNDSLVLSWDVRMDGTLNWYVKE